MHEINVIGTMNLFAAASAPGSTVRNVVVKSSTLVYGSRRAGPDVVPRGDAAQRRAGDDRVERSLLEVEGYVRDFAEDNPHVNVTLLRFSNVLGPDIVTPLSKALELPVVPSLFGFDPRFQFVHEDDVVALDPVRARPRGAGHLQRRRRRAAAVERGGGHLRQADVPLPPFGMSLAAAPLRRLRRRAAARAARRC